MEQPRVSRVLSRESVGRPCAGDYQIEGYAVEAPKQSRVDAFNDWGIAPFG